MKLVKYENIIKFLIFFYRSFLPCQRCGKPSIYVKSHQICSRDDLSRGFQECGKYTPHSSTGTFASRCSQILDLSFKRSPMPLRALYQYSTMPVCSPESVLNIYTYVNQLFFFTKCCSSVYYISNLKSRGGFVKIFRIRDCRTNPIHNML